MYHIWITSYTMYITRLPPFTNTLMLVPDHTCGTLQGCVLSPLYMWIDSFTVSLHSPNGRHCLPLGLCKESVSGLKILSDESIMHCDLPIYSAQVMSPPNLYLDQPTIQPVPAMSHTPMTVPGMCISLSVLAVSQCVYIHVYMQRVLGALCD